MVDFSALNKLGDGENAVSHPPVRQGDSLEMKQLIKAREREAWQRCQNNLRIAQGRKTDILKQIQDKKEPLSILLTALETISYLTDDDVFLLQAQKDLIKMYSGE